MNRKEYQQAWRAKNPTKTSEYCKRHRQKLRDEGRSRNPPSERVLEYRRRWQKENRESRNASATKWRRKWKEENGIQFVSKYQRERRKVDLGYKISGNLKNRIRWTLRGVKRSKKTEALLGCSTEEFLQHLENKFHDGMSWENYGVAWEIDHVTPIALFDLTRADHQAQCFHYSNLQPLTVTANRAKRIKLPEGAPLPC